MRESLFLILLLWATLFSLLVFYLLMANHSCSWWLGTKLQACVLGNIVIGLSVACIAGAWAWFAYWWRPKYRVAGAADGLPTGPGRLFCVIGHCAMVMINLAILIVFLYTAVIDSQSGSYREDDDYLSMLIALVAIEYVHSLAVLAAQCWLLRSLE